MDPAIAEPTLLEKLLARKAQVGAEWDELIDAREKDHESFEARMLDEDEAKRPSEAERDAERSADEAFKERCASFRGKVEEFNERIVLQQEKAERAASEASAAAEIGDREIGQESVYSERNAGEACYWKDLCGKDPTLRGAIARDWGASDERLSRHGKEIEERMPKEELLRQRRAEKGIEEKDRAFRADMASGMRQAGFSTAEVTRLLLRHGIEVSPFERAHYTPGSESRANPSRQPGAGGEFVPPKWEIDKYLMYLRATRTIAPLCTNLEVPSGTNTVKLPKVVVPTEVAPQLLDNAGVASRDIQTGYVETAFKTLAGQEDVAIQLIEQSPDEIFAKVVMEDLINDYHLKLDQNISYAAGTEVKNLAGGTIKGLYPASNWEGTKLESTNAEGEKGVAGVYFAALGAAWSQIAKKRYSTAGIHHVWNPRRAAYVASLLDGTESKSGRPILNARDFPNFNIIGELDASITAPEGLMFQTALGPNVYATNNIHTHDNEKGEYTEAGKADYQLTCKFDDVWLFESDLRTRVLPEVSSGTLQIRYQVYAYVGSLVRYGQSVVVACGKPFKEPTLFGFEF
jgi:hypothetical protein